MTNPHIPAADHLAQPEGDQPYELLGIKNGIATFRMKGTGFWIRTPVYEADGAPVTRFAPDLLKVG